MTGNLERLINLRNADVHKDANIQAAEDIGKKAELGYFDVEFTMYGCAYLERFSQTMQYRISSSAEDIYDYIESAAGADIYPSKVETMTFACPVPAGTRALIAQDVKIELAKTLRQKYTKAFFAELYDAADAIHDNKAAGMLWQEAEAAAGRFEEAKLASLENLTHYTYSCKRIEKETYEKIQQWIADERKSMDDDVLNKDIFAKTLYGIVYREAGGLKYCSNAQRAHIYQKAYGLETQGVLVSPLYVKTYWYNYDYRLPDVIQDYKADLKRAYDQEYIAKLASIRGEAGAEQKEAFAQKLASVAGRYGSDSAETMKRYGYRWGVL